MRIFLFESLELRSQSTNGRFEIAWLECKMPLSFRASL